MGRAKRIAIVTDAWNQVNGVVTTLGHTIRHLKERGFVVEVFHSGMFKTISAPSYPEIKLALFPYKALSKMLADFGPDRIHIPTEGPLGWAGRRYCRRNNIPYTTSYHTSFPEYLHTRYRIPLSLTWSVLRYFHKPALKVLANTPTMINILREHGIINTALWSRGVDRNIYKESGDEVTEIDDIAGPILVYAGRLAVEKNLDAFLKLEIGGTKLIIGDGPEMTRLRSTYPNAIFVGYKTPAQMAQLLSKCDVFVFPSKTDTFGLVMIEAMACGLPVAAYPVQGPMDIVEDGISGALRDNLWDAITACYSLKPEDCKARAAQFTWENATDQFVNSIGLVQDSKNAVSSTI